MVVDIGAHKGYSARMRRAGARTVVSYEPETENFALLAKAADAKRGEWQTRRSAVGAERGEAELHVMGASWGHALHPPEAFAKHESASSACGSRRLRTSRGCDPLARGARVIVKVNIEGEECPTILGTPGSAWAGIDELYVETHPWAACGADELARHLAAAGLVPARAPIRRLRARLEQREAERRCGCGLASVAGDEHQRVGRTASFLDGHGQMDRVERPEPVLEDELAGTGQDRRRLEIDKSDVAAEIGLDSLEHKTKRRGSARRVPRSSQREQARPERARRRSPTSPDSRSRLRNSPESGSSSR